MDLKKFRVSNYRSIDDSEFVEVGKSTVLIGANESGKSNLLRALCSLKPDDEKNLPNWQKDFPRHKQNSDDEHSTPFINSIWELEEDERKELEGICPRIDNSRPINLKRNYKGEPYFEIATRASLIGLLAKRSPIAITEERIRRSARLLILEISDRNISLRSETSVRVILREGIRNLEMRLNMENFENKLYDLWADSCLAGLIELREMSKKSSWGVPLSSEKHVRYLRYAATHIKRGEASMQEAKDWLWAKVPTFIYTDEYPKIYGEYDINEYWTRKEDRKKDPKIEIATRDTSFERLCQAAEIKPRDIPIYNKSMHEDRGTVVDRASRVLTNKINALWGNIQLEVILQLDGDLLFIYIKRVEGSEIQTDKPAKVHLNQQSLGFQWFFNFYITFAARTNFGNDKDKILLLDEPGLHLHAQSQDDLVQHFRAGFKNQILYTTHSPFMIPDRPEEIRIVGLGDDGTTKVMGNSEDNRKNIFAYEVALRMNLSQSKRIAPYTLIVEGKTDAWILNAVSRHFRKQGKKSQASILPGLEIVHAGGVSDIQYFAARLLPEKAGVMALFDQDEAGEEEKELMKFSSIDQDNTITVAEAFKESPDKEATIEDILGDELYRKLIRRSYEEFAAYETDHLVEIDDFLQNRFKDKSLVKRYQELFKSLKSSDADFRKLRLGFNKTAIIKTFCKLMLDPEEAKDLMSEEVEARFIRLFKRINQIKDTKADEGDKTAANDESNTSDESAAGDEGNEDPKAAKGTKVDEGAKGTKVDEGGEGGEA